MVRSLGSNHATDRHHLFLIGNRQRGFLRHSSYCCRAQFADANAPEVCAILTLLMVGQRDFSRLRRVTHEFREPIDWLAKQQERFRASLVNALRPGRNRGGCQKKGIGSLLERPAASGSKFKNRQSLRGSVARPSVRCNYGHSRP